MQAAMLSQRPVAAGKPLVGDNAVSRKVFNSAVYATRHGNLTRVRAQRPEVNATALEERPTILVTEKLGAGGVEMLKEVGNVDLAYNLSKEELLKKIPQADALIVRSATKVTRDVIEAAKSHLKVVGRAGVGIDNVDLAAASENGCLVVNAPTANTVAAAEHGIALLCAVARNIAQADASMKAGKWDRTTYVGASLVGKTLAVMGFGKVGSEVARRARGLGMNVIAYDPYASEERAAAVGVTLVSFDDALKQADYFSLHMPLNADTKHIFNDDAFAKMKPGARLVNVARGGVIDDAALVRALDAKIVVGAGLDVFDPEPPSADNPLIARPDVICTPHLGASTREAQEEVAYEIAEAVISALRGEIGSSVVNAPSVSPEVLRELQPFVSLAEGLGKVAVELVEEQGTPEVTITYHSPRGDLLDTRLLRAMVLKGFLEQVTNVKVNIVNADLLARNRGLRVKETVVPSDGDLILDELQVSLACRKSRFTAALDDKGQVSVAGAVKPGLGSFLTRLGRFDVDVALEGEVVLVRQQDQPGIISAVSSDLAKEDINISYMTVVRNGGKEAVMAIGVDSPPSAELLRRITAVKGVLESGTVSI